MREYIAGYYCRDDLHLQVVNKDSNRKIINALREAYPAGLDAYELAKASNLPLKTIYAQKAELYREYYINDLVDKIPKSRGRPTLQKREQERSRKKIVLEEASGLHDPFEGRKPTPLPPGNVVYSEGFIDAWHTIVSKGEENDLCITLIKFLEKALNRIIEHDNERIRTKWAPERKIEHCCSQCGLNHEARDFMRAILLHLIDQVEKHGEFIDFMKANQFLRKEAYDNIKKEMRNLKYSYLS
jgi:hypothetical protein